MFEVTYGELFIGITVLWIASRVIVGVKTKRVSLLRELQMLMIYICVVVIARIVYFPWHHVDGHIDTMRFNSAKLIPLRINLIPVKHLFDIYDGWQMNIIGNIAMFIPVGIVWPICFKKLNNIGKNILAGALFSLIIEITQLPFYERCSDVDDIILNTTGVAIGAIIFFICKAVSDRKKRVKKYKFYGNEAAATLESDFGTACDVYDRLSGMWCAETCAPRLREKWSPDNRTLGQCSITAFLVQDIFGGEVYAVITEFGMHCYNKVGDAVFDLTSEQFKDGVKNLVYDCTNPQSRDDEYHFGKEEKRERYILLKKLFYENDK